MSKKTDVVVIGSGMAGLTAAVAAAKRGLGVHVVSQGMGALGISGGTIDLLGYGGDGKRLENPWDGMAGLDAAHPYSLLGPDYVKTALEEVGAVLNDNGLPMQSMTDETGAPRNALYPTIMGTFKPVWLYPASNDLDALHKAKSVLVVGVRGFRDCRAHLVTSQLRRYKGWEDREYATVVLPPPFKEGHRSLSALDLAHVADRPAGREWMLNTLKGIGKKHDIALLPPMLGAKADSGLRKIAAETIGCPVVELISVPPGVAGMRIRDALLRYLYSRNVEFYENAEIRSAKVENGKCASIVSHSTGRETTHEARAVVVATGGILNGGVILSQGNAREHVFGIDIPVPEDVDDWTEVDVFGKHLISSLGVKASPDLRAIGNDGKPILENVFFAGRTLGGYDYAAEKSGHGVAAATGWKAGNMAAGIALGNVQDQKASGAAI